MNRIVLKALSWETLAGLFCLGLAYLFFGHWDDCLVFTVVAFIFKLVLFYWHEKLWEITMFNDYEIPEEWDDYDEDDEANAFNITGNDPRQ